MAKDVRRQRFLSLFAEGSSDVRRNPEFWNKFMQRPEAIGGGFRDVQGAGAGRLILAGFAGSGRHAVQAEVRKRCRGEVRRSFARPGSQLQQAAQRTKLDKLERKQRRPGGGLGLLETSIFALFLRYEIMNELMKCATNVKHLISPMFRCLVEHV